MTINLKKIISRRNVLNKGVESLFAFSTLFLIGDCFGESPQEKDARIIYEQGFKAFQTKNYEIALNCFDQILHSDKFKNSKFAADAAYWNMLINHGINRLEDGYGFKTRQEFASRFSQDYHAFNKKYKDSNLKPVTQLGEAFTTLSDASGGAIYLVPIPEKRLSIYDKFWMPTENAENINTKKLQTAQNLFTEVINSKNNQVKVQAYVGQAMVYELMGNSTNANNSYEKAFSTYMSLLKNNPNLSNAPVKSFLEKKLK